MTIRIEEADARPTHRHIRCASLFLSSFYMCVNTALANPQPIESLTEAQQIFEEIITIGKMPRPLSQVTGAITVIDHDQISRQLVSNIAQLVRYEPGVQTGNQGTRFGYSSYAIRGIGGNRVAIEVDGMPLADHFKIGSYSNAGRNLVDPDMIKQVEILRGPASALYGSDAIGGVVAYTTFDAADLLSDGKNVAGHLKASWHGVNNNHALSYRGAGSAGASSIVYSVKHEQGEQSDNQAADEITSDVQQNNATTLLFKYSYALNDLQKMGLSVENYKREAQTDIYSFIGQGRFASTTGLKGDDSSSRSNIALSWEFERNRPGLLSGGIIRAYQQISKTEQLTDELRFTRGTNYSYDRDFFYDQKIMGLRANIYGDLTFSGIDHRLGYGLEYSESRFDELRSSEQTNLDTNSSTNIVLSEVFPVRDFPISTVKKFGVYFNDEMRFSDRWSLMAGLRADQYQLDPSVDTIYQEDYPDTEAVSIDESSLSPKLGLNYNLSQSSKAYLQYSHGYRAPPFEDANIGFNIPLFGYRAIPNPELKSESSDSVELGFLRRDGGHRLEVVAFYNDYKNFIQSRVNLGVDPDSGQTTFQSQNIESAKIYGVELRLRHRWLNFLDSGLHLDTWLNAFLSKGENRETGHGLNTIEPAQAVAGFGLVDATERWKLDVLVTSVSRKRDYDEILSEVFVPPGYTTVDLIFNYAINDNFDVSLGVFNLGDRKYWRWSDVNGLTEDDPLVEELSSAGTNGSLNLRFHW